MKALKIISIILIAIGLFLALWNIILRIATVINPPYHVLADGSQGYVMNTENMFLATVVSFILTPLIIWGFLKKIKRSQNQ